MIHEPAAVLALAVGLGIGAQWLGSRLKIPSIVLMLVAGLAAGPGFGLIDPVRTFGNELLSSMIALGVGILLFEGGLGLRWAEIGSTTRLVVVRLLTLGVTVSLVLTSIAALLFTDLPQGVAILFGSIMVVTGPTVVIPLLRQARLRPRVGRILRWEGIIIDPVGAVLGVSVLEVLLVEDGSVGEAAFAVARTTVVGCTVGAAVAALLVLALSRHWVPDHLRGPLSLVAAVVAYAVANELGTDAGLYAATLAGVVLANQRQVAIAPIVELNEHISTIILAGIFVILGARVQADDLTDNLVPALIILVILVLIVRPLSVLASTIGTPLTRKERIYLASLAPRGIVAASVSAVFGFELAEAGLPGGDDLAAITFLVVAGTTIFYGPLARPLARRLQVDTPDPKGVVLVGARRWARSLGATLSDLGVPVLVVAEDETLGDEAREAGLLVYAGRLEGDDLASALDGVGGRIAVVGSGAEALDAFGIDRVVRHLGRANVWRVARDEKDDRALKEGEAYEGRRAFAEITQEHLDDLLADQGAGVIALGPGQSATESQMPLVVVSGTGVPRMATDRQAGHVDDRLVVLQTSALDAAPEPTPAEPSP